VKHLDLFSGIGGFALAAKWAGWKTISFVEIDAYCQKVLKKNFPDVPVVSDIRNVSRESFSERPDIITGGFPCQDISLAGKGAGINGKRSGLWLEMHRVICELRPRYVVVENVAALLNRGIDRVLRDLAASGYDAEWTIFSACTLGAPHTRERVFLVAYPSSNGFGDDSGNESSQSTPSGYQSTPQQQIIGREFAITRQSCCFSGRKTLFSDTTPFGILPWATEPRMDRVANGIPHRVDRLRGLGNAIVPAVAYEIFRSINDAGQDAITPAR
jgi:DNA (cytosine-5)-methyltransferase 1